MCKTNSSKGWWKVMMDETGGIHDFDEKIFWGNSVKKNFVALIQTGVRYVSNGSEDIFYGTLSNENRWEAKKEEGKTEWEISFGSSSITFLNIKKIKDLVEEFLGKIMINIEIL